MLLRACYAKRRPLAVVAGLWLLTVVTAMAVDLDKVHNLCQAREFHSFRRKVCLISKRSIKQGEYAAYALDPEQNRHLLGVTRDVLQDASPTTPDETIDTSGGMYNRRVKCRGQRCGQDKHRRSIRSKDTFGDWQNGNSFTILLGNGAAGDDMRGRFDALSYLRAPYQRIVPASITEHRKRSIRANIVDSNEKEKVSNTFQYETGNEFEYTDANVVFNGGDVDRQFINLLGSNLRDDFDKHSLRDPTFALKQNFTRDHIKRIMDFVSSLYDEEDSQYGTLADIDPAFALNHDGLLIEDGGTVYDAGNVHAYSVHYEDSPEQTYSHLGAEIDDVYIDRKPVRVDKETTVGMLRNHCCIHGCTLNRHFLHFLSTCATD